MLDSGVDGTTIEDIAARSGVAKSTIYRHFGDRETLIGAAIRSRLVEAPTPDTGSLTDDLVELFGRYDTDENSEINRLFPMLLDAARREPALHDLRDRVIAERQRPLRTVIKLAQARGEVDPDLDLEVAMAVLIGPFTYRSLVQERTIDAAFIATAIPAAAAALRSTATDDGGS